MAKATNAEKPAEDAIFTKTKKQAPYKRAQDGSALSNRKSLS